MFQPSLTTACLETSLSQLIKTLICFKMRCISEDQRPCAASLYKTGAPPKIRVQASSCIAQFFQDKEGWFFLLTSHLNWCNTDQNRGNKSRRSKDRWILGRAPTFTVRTALCLRISCLPDAFNAERTKQHICNMALLATEYDKSVTKRKTSKSTYSPRTHERSDRT